MTAVAVTEKLRGFSRRIRVGEPQIFDQLLVMLLYGDPGGPDADLLDEAIPAGRTTLDEVGEQGVVNLLKVTHRGSRPLLLLDGEHVHGARQNRVFNTSLVVLPGATANVPVSCAERGRWRYRAQTGGVKELARRLESSEMTMPASARRGKLQRLTHTTMTGGGYDADQHGIWQDVDDYLDRTTTISPTRACVDAYQQRRSRIEAKVRQLAPASGQTGFAVYHGQNLVTLDLFGSAALFGRAWLKIARGIASDTYDDMPFYHRAGENCRATLRLIAQANELCTECCDGCGPTLHGLIQNRAFSAATYQGDVYHAMVAGVVEG